MSRKILEKDGTSRTWKVGGTYAITLASIADDAARQGVKGDLGALRAPAYKVRVDINMDVAPTSGATIEFWWSSSPSETAGTKNTGACSGVDAAYTGSPGDEIDDTKGQMLFIGPLVLTSDADAVVQSTYFTFVPPERYGMPVVVNKGGQALEGDDDSHCITITERIPEVQ